MKEEKNIKVYLTDIIESINKIEEYTKGISEEKFYNREQIQDSVLRRLEIIGEAVNNLPDSFKNKHSAVPWRKISGMRNILIHEYFGVNIKRVWRVVEEDIPSLKKKVNKIKGNIS